MVPSASLKRAEFDLQQARKEVEEGAKRLDRLKKVFGEQAGVVREAVLKVLGGFGYGLYFVSKNER